MATKCKKCKKDVPGKAKICPHCGVKNPTVPAWRVVLTGFILLGGLTFGLRSCSSDSPPEIIQAPIAATSEKPVTGPATTAAYDRPITEQCAFARSQSRESMELFKILYSKWSIDPDKPISIDAAAFNQWRAQFFSPKLWKIRDKYAEHDGAPFDSPITQALDITLRTLNISQSVYSFAKTGNKNEYRKSLTEQMALIKEDSEKIDKVCPRGKKS
ncbi:hypothetical protein [Sodalis sp. RH18]|uniref:hypothetical protein n=1 Tax=Sodalis sp. RH18 TaxID=3394333 RepID=UPI0039B36904